MADFTGAADLSALTPKKNDPAGGPFIRLLLCLDENTIEELPDYEGPSDRDYLLALAIEQRHTDNLSGTPHRGNIVKVPLKYWADAGARAQILKQVREGSGGISELDATFYDTKSQFQEDALACFQRHLRPPGQCPDYMSDSKKLIPKTSAERKDIGLPDPKDLTDLPKLCQFCPVHVYNIMKARQTKGLYS